MLDNATEKQLENLLKKLQPTTQPKSQEDIDIINIAVSKMTGVNDFQALMKDVNSNFLIQNKASQLMGNLSSLSGNTPMEILGSHMYEKCGLWLAPVSLFCTVFNHLDWEKFSQIAEERQAYTELLRKQESAEDDFFGEINDGREADKTETSGTS